MLLLYWRICFGTARTPEAATMVDLARARMVAARPDRARRIVDGHLPGEFIRPIRNDVGRILTRVEAVAPGIRT